MENNLKLNDYKKIVGDDVISEIKKKAKKFSNKHILCINSTYQGGGVAELLNTLVVLFNEVGIDFGWRILHGTPYFFSVTKKFHNGLQGDKINLSKKKKRIYHETNRRFSTYTHIDHDLVIVHDPQPLPLIDFYKKTQPWIWRCHIDLSDTNQELWRYLKKYIVKYDHMVVSKEDYEKNIKIPQSVIHPAIDPLSEKNRPLPTGLINKYFKKYNINKKTPIISQISRFDKWKDPIGVIKIFEIVRKEINCQLVLLGMIATDDPEGQIIQKQIEKEIEKNKYKKDIKLILGADDILVNCLQKSSSVIMQKSIREGFALTVSEALYKETPVVASNIGGIPLQIINGENGYLNKPDDYESFAASIVQLLQNKKLSTKLGKHGKEYIKRNFLITRLMLDWLDLFDEYL
jgi:trehalose synthase